MHDVRLLRVADCVLRVVDCAGSVVLCVFYIGCRVLRVNWLNTENNKMSRNLNNDAQHTTLNFTVVEITQHAMHNTQHILENTAHNAQHIMHGTRRTAHNV